MYKHDVFIGVLCFQLCTVLKVGKRLGAKTTKKSGAWIGAQLTILCSINRKLRSGDYKEIGVRFLCSV